MKFLCQSADHGPIFQGLGYFSFLFRLLLGPYGYILSTGNSKNVPYSIAVYLPAMGRKLLSTVLLLSVCSQLCGHISCEPFKHHSPVTFYYVLYHV